jgi:hypothetical protein
MRIFVALYAIITFSLTACTKSPLQQPNPKDSVLATILSSVSYFDEINQIGTRKDSLFYNQRGHLANWIYYSRKNSDSLTPTISYSFVMNKDNQINSFTQTTYDFWGVPTTITYALAYNAQNKLSGKTASPSSPNTENDFNVLYNYDSNNIFYTRIGDPSYIADTMSFQNKNMVFRAHMGLGEGFRGQLRNQEYLTYTSYPNPFYNASMSNFGALFFTCLLNNSSQPELDYLGDVLSGNMIDSLNFTTYLGLLKRDRGYYKFEWMADSTGKVVSGNYTSIDTTSEFSGYEAVVINKYQLILTIKTCWYINRRSPEHSTFRSNLLQILEELLNLNTCV